MASSMPLLPIAIAAAAALGSTSAASPNATHEKVATPATTGANTALPVGAAASSGPTESDAAAIPAATGARQPAAPAVATGAPQPAGTPGPAAAPALPEPLAPSGDLFVAKCTSCHSVGKGDRVGPDLKGVTERRPRPWLQQMIRQPSSLLDGDAEARALLARFNNVRMPDLGLTDEQAAAIVELLAYCRDNPCALAPKLKPVTAALPADVERGRGLFLGTEPRKNGGPACMSCHTVDGAGSVAAGGTLARDLTYTFARLGDAGLDAALKNPAFPLMNKVFGDKPLAEDEAFALRAFLYDANRGALAETADPFSVPLAAVVGTVITLLLLNAAWSRRLHGIRQPMVAKKGSHS